MIHILNAIFWFTGAAIWFLGGLGGVLVVGLFAIEFVTKRMGWYDLLWAGVVEAARKRQIQKRFKRASNLK